MKRTQILVVCMFLCMMFLPVLSVNSIGTVSDENVQPTEGTDLMEEGITELPTTIPRPEINAVLSDTPEAFSYVSSAVLNPIIPTYGFIDGKAYGDAGFTVANLQSNDNNDAVFEEVQYMGSAYFNYFFEIDTSQRTSWVQYDIMVEGYASSAPETVQIYYSATIDGTYSYLGSFLSTDTSRITKTFPISITTDTIYVQFAHTNIDLFEPVSQWKFDYICVRFCDAWTTNDRIKVDKLFDTDNLYPGRGYSTNSFYTFTAYVHDDDGGDTINHVELKLLGAEVWWVEWDSSTGWKQSQGSDEYIELVTTQSSVTIVGSELRIAFAVQFRFGHPEMTDVDWSLSSESASSADQDDYSTIYDYLNNPRYVDIHTAIEWGVMPHFSEDQCDPGSTVNIWGSATFSASAGSGTGADVSAVATRTVPGTPLWSESDTFTSGGFEVTCNTYGSAGDVNIFEVTIIDTYTGNPLLGPSSDSVKLDSVVAYEYGSTDGWLNNGIATTIYTKLRYVSDPLATDPITDGSVEWNGEPLNYQNGRWEASVVSANPDTIIYDSITDVRTPEGITTVETHPNTIVIWDRSKVLSYTVYRTSDDVELYQVDIGTSMYVDVQLMYEEEGSWVSDGTVVINDYNFEYTGSNGVWRYSGLNPSAVSFLTFDNVVCSGNTPLIDVVNQNGKSATIIWNTFMVEMSVDDAHVDIDDYVRICAYVTRAYDGSIFTDSMGTVVLRHTTSGNIPMTYSSVDGMWYEYVTQNSVNQWTYYIYSITDNVEGISTVGRGMNFDGSNDYVNCGSDSSLDLTSTLTLSTWFYGDGSNWGSGMYILAKKDDNAAQYALYVHPEDIASYGNLRFQYYNDGLREIEIKSDINRNEWHHTLVTISGTTLNAWFDGEHILVDDTLPIALKSYSSVPLLIGAQTSGAGTSGHFEGFVSEIRVYSTALTDLQCELLYQGQYPIDTNLRLLLERSSIDSSSYLWSDASTNSNDGSIYGALTLLGTIPMSLDEVVRPIWDQVINMGYSSDAYCIDVGTSSSNHVNLEYAFSGDAVLDGNITVNGLGTSSGASDGEWDFSDTKSSAQLFTYDYVSYSGGRYNLTSVNQNSQSLGQEWNEILILTIEVVKSHLNLGMQAEIRVTARLSYYSDEPHNLSSDDTLILNGFPMEWSSADGGFFYYLPSQGNVGSWNYYINNSVSNNEETYGISAVNIAGLSVDVIWTGLIIDITDPTIQETNIGTNATGIHYSVTYAHNGAPYDGSVSMNNTQFIYNSTQRQGYRLSPLIGDDTLGITHIITDDETWCIWNSIIVSITDPNPQTVLVGQNVSGIVVTATYAYDGTSYDGTLTLNDTTFDYHTDGQRGYTVISASGDSHGITVISANDVTYAIWARDIVTMTNFQYGYNDTTSEHNVWTYGGNASGYLLSGLTLFMSNSYIGLLEAAWAETDLASESVSVLRYPVLIFDYDFTQNNLYVNASIELTYKVGLLSYHLTINLDSGENVIEINLLEYGLSTDAEITKVEVMLFETIASADNSTSSIQIFKVSLTENAVTWSHDYGIDVRLVADEGSTTENIVVHFYIFDTDIWVLVGSDTTNIEGWANLYYNTRNNIPGETLEFMVTWNATDTSPYLQGEDDGNERDYVLIIPIKVYAYDIVITSEQSPIQYKDILNASVIVLDQDGNAINSSLGFAYRLECSEINSVGDWGYWDSSDWHDLGVVLYPAGESLTLLVSFQTSIYYELVDSPSETIQIIKRELLASTLGSYISWLIHTQLGDTPAGAYVEYSDALKVTIMIFDVERSEFVTEVLNITYSYESSTYWGMSSDGSVSIIFPDIDFVGGIVTATLANIEGQNYTLVNNVVQTRSITTICETITSLSVSTDEVVGVDYPITVYVTAMDNDNEGVIDVQITINGTDIFTFNNPEGLVTFSDTHLISLLGNLSIQALNGSSNYNIFSSTITYFTSCHIELKMIIVDSYALDIVDVTYYLYNVDDSEIILVEGNAINATAFFDSGILASSMIYTNASGYASLSFNLSLGWNTIFYANGSHAPDPSVVVESAVTLARPLGITDIGLITPKGIQYGNNVNWSFTDQGNFTIIVHDYAGTVVTVPVMCTLYSGSTVIWTEVQSGNFEFSMRNIWGINCSSSDIFQFRLTVNSIYHDPSWFSEILVNLKIETGVVTPSEESYEVNIDSNLNISALLLDSSLEWIEGNVTDITGTVLQVPACLYIYDEGWQLVDDILVLIDGSIVYNWNYETLALPRGVYDFEFRYGGLGTGFQEMSAGFTLRILGKTAILHLDVITDTILVSILYDPQHFEVNMWLTNSSDSLISGWINVTVSGDEYSFYCDGISYVTFSYYPSINGEYTIQSIFEGDDYYASTTHDLSGLTANLRELTYESDIPTEICATVLSSFSFINVYDNDFTGTYQSVTYINDYPINASLSLWWTLSPDYQEPRIFVDTWQITQGTCLPEWAITWDLNGDGQLTSSDFECYVVMVINGQGVYEDITIKIPVKVIQPLFLDMQISSLTFSDPSTITIQLTPLNDESFSENLEAIDIELFVSNDNSSWVLIDSFTTDDNGRVNSTWTCWNSSNIFFKAESSSSDYYFECLGYSQSTVSKETTVLTIESVGQFTYSDQGIVVASLHTDDGEPIVGYSVFLEIFYSGNWISISSALSNDTGHVSILWIPTLIPNVYDIQVRASFVESQYYNSPETILSQLVVSKETLFVIFEQSMTNEELVVVKVLDDEDIPVEGIEVNIYRGNENELLGTLITDDTGYARLNTTINNGEMLRIEIEENSYYHGVVKSVEISLPMSTTTIIGLAAGAFGLIVFATVFRKILGIKTPSEITPEVKSILKKVKEKSGDTATGFAELKKASTEKAEARTYEGGELSTDTDPTTADETD